MEAKRFGRGRNVETEYDGGQGKEQWRINNLQHTVNITLRLNKAQW